MKYSKRLPTKPGFYGWRDPGAPDYEPVAVQVLLRGGRLIDKSSDLPVEEVGGLWTPRLVPEPGASSTQGRKDAKVRGIEPCPFCGRKALLRCRPAKEVLGGHTLPAWWSIRCSGRQKCPVAPLASGETEAQVLMAWNTRVPAPLRPGVKK